MSDIATIELRFMDPNDKIIYYRNYNQSISEDIMNELKFISNLDGFTLPDGQPFARVSCYWGYNNNLIKQWSLEVC